MFKRILVPLDGGELAAGVLRTLAPFRERGAELDLLLVLEPGQASGRDAAERYLSERAAELSAQGWSVRQALAEGDPAEQILARVEAAQPDLVALASHGRRGPWRWLRGSVAERVLRHCAAPVLIAHPAGEGASHAESFERIMVPLDGSERAQEILPLALAFARAFSSELVLFRASDAHHLSLAEFLSPSTEDTLPPTTHAQLERDLHGAQESAREAGVSVRLQTAFGDPANEILESAQRGEVDVIALTTHGRTGWDRWVFGSVAEKVLRAWPRTLLVLRNPSSPSS